MGDVVKQLLEFCGKQYVFKFPFDIEKENFKQRAILGKLQSLRWLEENAKRVIKEAEKAMKEFQKTVQEFDKFLKENEDE